jgi:hypothetical protein
VWVRGGLSGPRAGRGTGGPAAGTDPGRHRRVRTSQDRRAYKARQAPPCSPGCDGDWQTGLRFSPCARHDSRSRPVGGQRGRGADGPRPVRLGGRRGALDTSGGPALECLSLEDSRRTQRVADLDGSRHPEERGLRRRHLLQQAPLGGERPDRRDLPQDPKDPRLHATTGGVDRDLGSAHRRPADLRPCPGAAETQQVVLTPQPQAGGGVPPALPGQLWRLRADDGRPLPRPPHVLPLWRQR